MGFTIEDMLLLSKERYKMELIGGKNGWSNSINWVLMIEDTAITNNFSGKELVVTTGLGFGTQEKMLDLAKLLVKKHSSGLVLNTGEYIKEVPKNLIEFCNANDFPLLTVPWEVYLVDMIKDLSIRIFLQGSADEQIIRSMINAIESPDNQELYRKELLPYFDVDGEFQVVLLTTDGLDEMDTVERRKLSHRLQIYLENITHNGSFFYYDSNFVLVMNDVSKKDFDDIIEGMVKRTKKRMPDIPIYVGAGSKVVDIANLSQGYKRAKSAIEMAKSKDLGLVNFDEMGIYRLLYSIEDKRLLKEMSEELLKPLIEYDEKHNSNYIETLEWYLKCNGSIQAVSEVMFTHRNTVIYRIANIKKMLGCEFDSEEEKVKYLMAFYIKNM